MGTIFSALKIGVYEGDDEDYRHVKHYKDPPFVLVTYSPKAGNLQLEFDKRYGVYTNNTEKLDRIRVMPSPPVHTVIYKLSLKDVKSVVVALKHTNVSTVSSVVGELLEKGMKCIQTKLNDADKVRLLYYWLTSQEVRRSKYCVTTNMFSVDYQLRELSLKNNSYAAVFSLMCHYADIPCVVVHGCVKGGNYYPGYKNLWVKMIREWNAVLVDGQWRLVDSLWGVAADDSASGCTEVNTDAWYLFPDPKELIYSHYPLTSEPLETNWQLLSEPLTKEAFEEQVFIKRRFFKLGMGLMQNSLKHGVVVSKTGEVNIVFENRTLGNEFETLVSKYNGENKTWQCMKVATVDVNRDKVVPLSIKATFHQKGVYKIEVVGRKRLRSDKTTINLTEYDWVAIYNVIIETPIDLGWGPTDYLARFGLIPQSHQQVNAPCEPGESTEFVFKVKPEMIEAIALETTVVRPDNRDAMRSDEHDRFVPDSEGIINVPVTIDEEGEFYLYISASVNDVDYGEVVKYKMICKLGEMVQKIKEALTLLNEALASRNHDELKRAVNRAEQLEVARHSNVVKKYKSACDILKIPEITRNTIATVRLAYSSKSPSDDVISVVNATLLMLGFNKRDLGSPNVFLTLISKFQEFKPDHVSNSMCVEAEQQLGSHGDLERVVKQNKDLAAFGSWLLGVFEVKGYTRQNVK